uniref:Poly [ADP-ribose] polymerase n=1 Tax=Latimeria chalumnae TaxID=7897 RepID=H2ZUR6_LATCH
MTIGSLNLHIILGDIVTETVDVLVNSTNFFTAPATGVAKAIFSAAGSAVEQEVKREGPVIPQDGIFSTRPGGLRCKLIFHINGHKNIQVIKKVVKNVILECEKQSFTSVAFPAMCTGQGGLEPRDVADAMFDSIALVARDCTTPSLESIRIVTIQKKVFDVFKTVLENRFGMLAPTKTHFEKLKEFKPSGRAPLWGSKQEAVPHGGVQLVFETAPFEQAVFDVIGRNKSTVQEAKTKLKRIFNENFSDRYLENELVATLSPEEVDEVLEVGAAAQVQVVVERWPESGRVKLRGAVRDVQQVYEHMQRLIQQSLEKQLEKKELHYISKVVQWQYEQGDREGFHPFDEKTNYLIEKAYMEKHKDAVVTMSDRRVLYITFETKQATMLEEQNRQLRLKRVEINSDNCLPQEWEDMDDQLIMPVPLLPKSREYQEVEKNFKKTASDSTVVKIERIQNLFLFRSYKVRKNLMSKKNGVAGANEKILFHGTAGDACSSINRHGFNRSFAGQNGVNYGYGVYFALKAKYSANNKYSKPDAAGHRYIYQAKVLAGMFTEGKKGMKVPPARSTKDATDLYDSVVDSISNPEMFVIFHDDQAYPEYLITFK